MKRVVLRPRADGKHRGYLKDFDTPYKARRPRRLIYIPSDVLDELDEESIDTRILLRRVWTYMTKDMVITAIKTQHPDLKIRTKDSKLKLIRQWLSTGIVDPFEEWKPLSDRFLWSLGP